MTPMDGSFVFGIIFPAIGCLQMITIFICSSYVLWFENRNESEQGYLCWIRRNRSNSKNPNALVPESATNTPTSTILTISPATTPTVHPSHKPYETKINRLQRKSVLLMSICSFFALITCSGVLSLHIIGLIHKPITDTLWCEKILPKIYSISYVLSNVSLYQFLNTRSELVKTAAETSKNFQRLRQFAKLLATCAPVVAIINIFLWGGRIVEVDGIRYCVDAPSWENSLFFLLVSIFVSTLYLILFIWPLRAHISQMGELNSDSSQAILTVVKRNFILSAIATSSTMISMIFFVSTTLAYKGHPSIFVYGVTIGVIDLCINNLCISLMTGAWIPKKLKGFRFNRTDTEHQRQQYGSGTITPALSDERTLPHMKTAPSASIDGFVKTNASEVQSDKE